MREHNGVILLHGAENVQSTDLPLSAFGRVYGGGTNISMDRCSLIVDELQRLRNVVQAPFQ